MSSGAGSRTIEEGDKLLSSAFSTQGQSNGGEASNGIEAEDDIVVLRGRSVLCPELFQVAMEAVGEVTAYLQLVDEHGDGVKLIVRIRRVSHGERVGRKKVSAWRSNNSIKVLQRWRNVSARKA